MLKNIMRFYAQGFANMTLGRTLWKIIIIKLLVIFIVLKFFIYGDSIRDLGGVDERRDFVLDNLAPLESTFTHKDTSTPRYFNPTLEQRSSNGSY